LVGSDNRVSTTDQRSFLVPLTIGVIADTHVYSYGARRLPEEILDLFRRFDVGLILHAGDVNIARVIDQLSQVAPVIAVKGNNDDQVLSQVLPTTVNFAVGPFKFVLLHGHMGRTARSEAAKVAKGVDCVVYGHSHIPMIEMVDDAILFNPGSATDRRWQEHFGVGLIQVTQDKIEPDLILYHDPRHVANVKPDSSS
jgi:uncharacterized protein